MYLTIFILSLRITLSQDQTVNIFISPQGNDQNDGLSIGSALKSPICAVQKLIAIRKSESSKEIILHFGPGEYAVQEPLIFNSEEISNQNSQIIIRSDPGNQVIISGARSVQGWKNWKGNIWRTYIPEVKEGKWDFRQVWVNGELRHRARIPNSGFYRVAGFPDGGHEISYQTPCRRFEFEQGQFNPKWKNLRDIEVIVYHFWTDTHLHVDSVNSKTNIVSFQNKSAKVFTDDFTANGARYIIENVFEGLDSPGEWYMDKQKGYIYYIPMEGEDPSKMEFMAPVTEKFIIMKGIPEKNQYLENITFENLQFRYTNYLLPADESNDAQASSAVSAAICLTGVKNCSFKNCTIQNTGNYAIEVIDGSSNNTFSHNLIHNIGAGGFRINGGTDTDSPLLHTSFNNIIDNEITYYGEEFPSGVGVLLMNTSDNKIEHNLIHHGWYTGISVGWSWGYQRSISINNLIAYNHIHTIGQGLLSDMGGIYTLGVSPGTVLRNNLIHDIDANQYGGWGIYNDEGSTHILVENNIVYNTKFAGYDIHYTRENTVRNNIFAFGRLQQINRTRMEDHVSVYFENNIVYWKEGKLFDDNWKDKSYEFYLNPVDGKQTMTTTFITDWNVFYNPNLVINQVDFAGSNWDAWHKRGKDIHSVYADPLFRDADHFDFTLMTGSPALSLGFKQIDMSEVGPRKESK